MNQKNITFIKDQLKFTGFGDALEQDVQKSLDNQVSDHKITLNTKFQNDSVEAVLHFKKSLESDMYFFNNYKLTVRQHNRPGSIDHTFYINKGNNITLKEAYNLICGRAINKDLVNKDGQFYNAWLQMEFKQTEKNGDYKLHHFHQNYGYDLEAALVKHPIKELGNETDRGGLIESLKRGNRQSVTFVREGKEQKLFIEANPKFKTLNIYDGSLQRIYLKREGDTGLQKGQQQHMPETKNGSQKTGRQDANESMIKPEQRAAKKHKHSME